MTEQASAAPGRSAQHRYAVGYIGNFQQPYDGTSIAIRAHATALAKTGMPVLLRPISQGRPRPGALHGLHLPDAIDDEIALVRRTSASVLFPLIHHLVVHDAGYLRHQLVGRAVSPLERVETLIRAQQHLLSSSIVYSVWERENIPEEVAEVLASVARCWVPSQHNRDLLLRHGVERVSVIPHPYADDHPLQKAQMRRRRPAKNFYAIGRWEPRKGFDHLIQAFVRAFSPGEATLTLKVPPALGWPDYPGLDETIIGAVNSADAWSMGDVELDWGLEGESTASIRVVQRHLSTGLMMKLHFLCDVYVCSSHGEAWCLPAFDAKLAGNRLVYVDHGGPRDFATDADFPVPTSGLEEVPKAYGWHGAQWAGYCPDRLAAALREAHCTEVPRQTTLRGAASEVGRWMRRDVLEVADSNPDARAYLESVE